MEVKTDLENRVVVLIDMDCFYCQVEEKLNPELKGMPIAVVQYNPWKGGGIIAVNYVARAQGVTRGMRGDEAREKCPDIQLPSVPCTRGKADISKYRDAGKEVARVLQKYTKLLERASIDEAYLDITAAVLERLQRIKLHGVKCDDMPNTFVLGYDNIDKYISDVTCYDNDSIDFDHENSKRLLIGAVIVSEIRKAVYDETGYQCSAGIAHNKILAKLVCGMNKPNKQTVLPKHTINLLYRSLPVKKVKHLGGKFGDSVCQQLKISKMAELLQFTEKQLQTKFDEKNGSWLYNIARGTDLEPVQARFNPKSIGCCKQFKGKQALLDLESLRKWLKDLGDEIEDRLEKDALENNRTPKQVVVSFVMESEGRDMSSSRSYNFTAEDELSGPLFSGKGLDLVLDTMYGDRVADLETNRKLPNPIKFLGLSVGKFEDHSETKKTRKIVDYFSAGTSREGPENEHKNSKKHKRKRSFENKIKGKSNDVVNETESINDKSKKESRNDGNKTSKTDKEFILQKYFQTTDNPILTETTNSNSENRPPNNETAVESTLDKQESFFARFLTKETSKNKANQIKTEDKVRPTTPQCKVIECGESSDDSNYSESTINNEINNSIALFEDDPADVNRITSMRTLLDPNKTERNSEAKSPVIQKLEEPSPVRKDTVHCEECNKNIPVYEFETHSDYHLALKLRDEERQSIKRDKGKVAIKNVVVDDKETKSAANSSIADFFDKITEGTPVEKCKECNKKIAVDKFQEHLDFHEAQKLSRELNSKNKIVVLKSSSNVSIESKSNVSINKSSTNSVKRKIKGISPPSKKRTPPCKSIATFFTNR